MEFRVNVHELVLLLHLLALLELVVDPLPSAEQAAEFGVRWHGPRSEFSRAQKGLPRVKARRLGGCRDVNASQGAGEEQLLPAILTPQRDRMY